MDTQGVITYCNQQIQLYTMLRDLAEGTYVARVQQADAEIASLKEQNAALQPKNEEATPR